MTDVAYRLTPFDGLLTHYSPLVTLLMGDYADDSPSEIDALVASGDCFVTLATTLDDSTESLHPDDISLRPQLEKLTRTLLYLQRYYDVVPKAAKRRK